MHTRVSVAGMPLTRGILVLLLATGCASASPAALHASSTATDAGLTATPKGRLPVKPRPTPTPKPVLKPAAPTTSGKPLAGRTIVLDPGHNGLTSAYPARANALVPAGGFTKPCNTSGTETNAGYSEHAYAFDVAQRAAALLRAQGARVILTRLNDRGFGPCVDERAAVANRAHADLTLSIHADGAAASGHGFHVIEPGVAPDGGNRAIITGSHALALALRTAFTAATGEPYASYIAHNGLDRRTDLAGLNLARVPAAFIECGNMRNSVDAAHVTSGSWRQSAARGVDSAVLAFLAR